MGGGGGINWQELFPTRLSGGIFITYMSLFVAQGKKLLALLLRFPERFSLILSFMLQAF